MKIQLLILITLFITNLSVTHQQTSGFLQTDGNNVDLYYTDGTYDPSIGTKLWRLSKLAYCHPSRITAWNYNKITGNFPGASDITVFYNTTGDNQGYTFYLPSDNTVYLVFRGTDPWSITNWLDDINTLYTSYPRCSGCQVHEGFYYSYLNVKSQVVGALQNLKQKYPSAKYIVTGHSLGAAIATHAAADIRDFTNVDKLYTYGSPRVGNPTFSSWYNNNVVDTYIARITHKRDPVPHLPPDALNLFIHVNQEVFYSSDSGFKLCSNTEDSTCCNQYLADIWIPDHLKYMGEDMTLDIIDCGIL